MNGDVQTSWWRKPGGIVLIGFLTIAGFLLFTEHRAHVLGILPYLLLAACPLMHIFMHHGHGSRDNTGKDGHNDKHNPNKFGESDDA